jgi:hypothetical protein
MRIRGEEREEKRGKREEEDASGGRGPEAPGPPKRVRGEGARSDAASLERRSLREEG